MDNAIGDGDVPTHSDGDLNIKSCVLMKSYICENKPLTHKMKSDFRLVYSPAYEFTWFKEECFAKGEKKKKKKWVSRRNVMRKISKWCHTHCPIMKERYKNSTIFNCYFSIIFHFFFLARVEGTISARHQYHFQIKQQNLPKSPLKK